MIDTIDAHVRVQATAHYTVRGADDRASCAGDSEQRTPRPRSAAGRAATRRARARRSFFCTATSPAEVFSATGRRAALGDDQPFYAVHPAAGLNRIRLCPGLGSRRRLRSAGRRFARGATARSVRTWEVIAPGACAALADRAHSCMRDGEERALRADDRYCRTAAARNSSFRASVGRCRCPAQPSAFRRGIAGRRCARGRIGARPRCDQEIRSPAPYAGRVVVLRPENRSRHAPGNGLDHVRAGRGGTLVVAGDHHTVITRHLDATAAQGPQPACRSRLSRPPRPRFVPIDCR